MHRDVQRTEKIFVLFGSIVFLCLGYFSIGLLHKDTAGPPFVALEWDRQIPFIPSTVWYYFLGLFGPILLVMEWVKSRRVFYLGVLSAILSACCCFVVFLLMPMHAFRPILDSSGQILTTDVGPVWQIPGDWMSLFLMDFLHAVDSKANTFPSLHIVYTVIFSIVLREEHPKLGRIFGLNAFLVFISILTTKQHFILDGVVGALLAIVMFYGLKKLLMPHMDRYIAGK